MGVLASHLGDNLILAAGSGWSARDITAVHVSELLDPTGYLSGGELLMTTGLQLPTSQLGCERYVARLVEADVSALALGLGPVHEHLPAPLATACRKAGLPLFIVPAQTPFLAVSKAYWAQVSHSATRDLRDVVSVQRTLVDAAITGDPVRAVLQVLVRALGGWAAVFSASGEVSRIEPPAAAAQAVEIRADLRRLAGVHTAASLATRDSTVLVYPLAVEGRVDGYLAVGSATPPDSSGRAVVLTATGILSIDAARRARMLSASAEAQRCVGVLLDEGFDAAARALASSLGSPLPTVLRLLAVRSASLRAVIDAVRHEAPSALVVPEDRRDAWVVLAAADGWPRRVLDAVRSADASATLALSAPVTPSETAPARARLFAFLAGAEPGQAQLPSESAVVDAPALLDTLSVEQRRILSAYLRHRGRWELAAKEAALARNTLRYRVDQIATHLAVDLTDPDVSAELWLALRSRG